MLATRPTTAKEAIGRWPGILQALGVDPRFLSGKHGPCPICQGTDRYRFDDKEGRGTWICSHCGSGDGFALLRNVYGWSFADAAKRVDQIVGTVQAGPIAPARAEESKRQALRAAWTASKPVTRGDPVWLYLNQRIGIDMVPADIRFHPALRYTDEEGTSHGAHPAMLAVMRYPDGTAASIHRTYLSEDGQKAAVPKAKKIMAGKPLQTSAVRLGPAGRRVGIAEGIETALAASRRFLTPVWAATNAVLLQTWVPPEGVEQVLIAGDNDASYTGQAAAFALARRLHRDGYTVEIQIPGTAGNDWVDEMKGKSYDH
jgi:putative DNA primase/helicase